jgi:DNA-binding PadR family transcriptional regulator
MLSSKNVMYVDKIAERHLKSSLDIVIMAILTGGSAHGYKIIATLHKEFGILLSPGSLYPLLHCLEEDKLIEFTLDKGKVVYRLTSSGKEKFRKSVAAYSLSIQKMWRFMKTYGESSPLVIQEAEEKFPSNQMTLLA